MQDTIIKGTGNSRTLASVPNFLTLYPTYEAFAKALTERVLPIDIGPINPAGVDKQGTDLTKANLLSDSTEISVWGSAADRTVDAALAQLCTLITTAQSTANTAQSTANEKVKVQIGKYAGTTNYGNTGSQTITFTFSPKVVMIATNDGLMYSDAYCYGGIAAPNMPIVKNGYNTFVISGAKLTATSSEYKGPMGNNKEKTYYYCAIG